MSHPRPTIILSGGFDPIHAGHIQMIDDASEVGDVLIILNNDNWLMEKKGYCFMKEKEREYILENIKGVTMVWKTEHKKGDKDKSVVKTLEKIKEAYAPADCLIFANGGDRVATNTLEVEYCLKNDIKLMFNVGGGKIQSSSELVQNAKDKIKT